MNSQKIMIVGAGLAGSLLAIYLARRGFAVDVYEAREDMRRAKMTAGRSINLALSNRGIRALREINLDSLVLNEVVPMRGRMIHAPDGATKLLPYSGRAGEFINSISRSALNIALMNEAEKHENVNFFFGEKLKKFDTVAGKAEFEAGKIVTDQILIATDGAGSAARGAMFAGVERFDFSQQFLAHGYKELHIPPAANGTFQMEKNALHIWARQRFLMIALPNFDGSFTVTLFLAHTGAESFENLRDAAAVCAFFEKNFADVLPLMPDLETDFFHNPVGNLGTIKCFPWNAGGAALLLGDAAHAVVPFYGQGMNCAFEDCRILSEIIDDDGAQNWQEIFDEFSAARKPDADAIADLAVENFYEMRDAVADPIFQRKRELETKLEHEFPDYFSKYSMVTFRDDLPYHIAKQRGAAQDALLMEVAAQNSEVAKLDLAEIFEQIKAL